MIFLRITNSRGLTLIELVIALVLFAVIATSLMRMTEHTIQYRKKLSKTVSSTKMNRTISQIMKRDLRNIFFTQDINALLHTLYSSKTHARKKISIPDTQDPEEDPIRQAPALNPYLHKQLLYFGGLKGKKDQLSFASFSNIQAWLNEKSSDQNEVSYYLAGCKSKTDERKQQTCLWRKSSTQLDQDLEASDRYEESIILEKVKSFHVSYFNIFQNKWFDEWTTKANEQGSLPAIIRVALDFENNKNQLNHQEFILPIYQMQLSLELTDQ